MPGMHIKRRIIAVAVAMFLMSIASADNSPSKKLDDKTSGWVSLNYQAVINKKLPLMPTQKPAEFMWIANVRKLPTFKNEFLFQIAKIKDDYIEICLLVPDGASIGDQMFEIKKERPEASLEKVSDQIRINKSCWESNKIPELKNLAHELESITVSTIPLDQFYMDGTGYEFVIQTEIDTNSFEITAPPFEDPARIHALLGWAEKVITIIEKAR